ncbi:MAG: SemiSWEET transporter [Chitinophagaceae bacterium]|nr:SemiSWEET transporter [Chitinophagaceae bacterium]
MNSIEIYIGIAAGIITAISLLPQLVKVIREKKAENISVIYLLTLMTGLSLWIWYGILREDLPIIFTNGFSVLVNIILMVLVIKYKKK